MVQMFGMVQGRGRFGFPLKPAEGLGVAGKLHREEI